MLRLKSQTLRIVKPRTKDALYATGSELQDRTVAVDSRVEVTLAIKNSACSAATEARGECALRSIRSKFEDIAASVVPSKEITCAIEGQASNIASARRKDALRSIGSKFEDLATGVVSSIKVTRAVKGQAIGGDAGGERALRAIESKPQDRASGLACHVEVGSGIKSQAGDAAEPRGEGAPRAVGSKFVDTTDVLIRHVEIA